MCNAFLFFLMTLKFSIKKNPLYYCCFKFCEKINPVQLIFPLSAEQCQFHTVPSPIRILTSLFSHIIVIFPYQWLHFMFNSVPVFLFQEIINLGQRKTIKGTCNWHCIGAHIFEINYISDGHFAYL